MDLKKLIQLGILIIIAIVGLAIISTLARVAIGLLNIALVVAVVVGLYLVAEQLFGKKR